MQEKFRICHYPTCFDGLCVLWVTRSSLLDLRAETKQLMGRVRLMSGGTCDPLEIETREEGKLQLCCIAQGGNGRLDVEEL